jgi:2-octaprenylphenol hydroxylase
VNVRGNRSGADFDVAVVGGGLIGATLAALLAKQDLRVVIVERGPATPFDTEHDDEARVLAITRASEQVLRAAGAWQYIEAGRCGYFREMLVWDAQGNGCVHFDSADICEATLGYIISAGLIQAALETALRETAGIHWFRPARLAAIQCLDERVELRLDDERRVSVRVVVGADGADSLVRSLAGIKTRSRDYEQTAIVCTVMTERPHGDIARQRFLATGPLAFLPLADPQRSSIVWSTTPERASEFMALPEGLFRAELGSAFGAALGDVVEVGRRMAFPLVRTHAERYVQRRLALAGDAAHRIHPLAGQGANLGLMDAVTLADVLGAAQTKGRDIGELSVLRRYERWRKGENLFMMLAMDAFKDGFSTAFAPVRWARNRGLDLVNAMPPVKREIMRRAMGLSGDLPSLALNRA